MIISASSFATYSRAYEAYYGANVANVGDGAATIHCHDWWENG